MANIDIGITEYLGQTVGWSVITIYKQYPYYTYAEGFNILPLQSTKQSQNLFPLANENPKDRRRSNLQHILRPFLSRKPKF